MKIETLEFPCGCKAAAVHVIEKEPLLWEAEFALRYCPLHGAAEKLLNACFLARCALHPHIGTELVIDEDGVTHDTTQVAIEACDTALASARVKPEATEGKTCANTKTPITPNGA